MSAPLGVAGLAVRENVRRLRGAQKLTTTALSARMGEVGRPILANGITKIEQGKRRVDADDLVALASAFDVSPLQLLAPFECHVCHGAPPAGFCCGTCGAAET